MNNYQDNHNYGENNQDTLSRFIKIIMKIIVNVIIKINMKIFIIASVTWQCNIPALHCFGGVSMSCIYGLGLKG